MDTIVRRGDIYYADLSPVVGSEQGGVRPVLIVQNDTGNRHSPTVIAAAITSQLGTSHKKTGLCHGMWTPPSPSASDLPAAIWCEGAGTTHKKNRFVHTMAQTCFFV